MLDAALHKHCCNVSCSQWAEACPSRLLNSMQARLQCHPCCSISVHQLCLGWHWQQGRPTVCARLSASCAALSARGTAASPTAAAAFCASLDTDCRQGRGDVRRTVVAACDAGCSSVAPGSKCQSPAAQQCQPRQLHICSLASCNLHQGGAAPQRCWALSSRPSTADGASQGVILPCAAGQSFTTGFPWHWAAPTVPGSLQA